MTPLLSLLAWLFAAVFVCGLGAGVALMSRRKAGAGRYQAHQCECAWCGALIRGGVEPVTHGICDECFVKAQNQAGELNDI